MKKRIFSRLMAMVMALSLLSTSALAVEVTQEYINGLSQNVENDEFGNQFVSVPQGEGGDNDYKLVEDVKTDYTLKFSGDREVTLDLNGHTIDHQKKAGSVILVDGGTNLTVDDTGSGEGKITGGTGSLLSDFSVSHGWSYGGGIYIEPTASLTLNGGNITGNTATYAGGGIFATNQTTLNINGGSITNNTTDTGGGVAFCSGEFNMAGGTIQDNHAKITGGGVALSGGEFNMIGGTIQDNHAKIMGGGVFMEDIKSVRTMTGITITGNTAGWGGGIIAFLGEPTGNEEGILPAGGVVCGNSSTNEAEIKNMLLEDANTDEAQLMQLIRIYGDGEHDFHGAGVWETTTEPTYDAPGERTCICPTCKAVLDTEEIPQLQRPTEEEPGETPPAADIDFGDGFPGGDTGTAIADEETPLAGILTLADLLNALYEHEDSPEAELPEKYAEHFYAPAISWALSTGIVADDETFDPDAIATVGLLREVLESYVAYKGIDFTVTVDGEDEDLVLDLGARLTAFYKELEAAQAGKAA